MQYNLAAVVVHQGDMRGGHYIAYVKVSQKGWRVVSGFLFKIIITHNTHNTTQTQHIQHTRTRTHNTTHNTHTHTHTLFCHGMLRTEGGRAVVRVFGSQRSARGRARGASLPGVRPLLPAQALVMRGGLPAGWMGECVFFYWCGCLLPGHCLCLCGLVWVVCSFVRSFVRWCCVSVSPLPFLVCWCPLGTLPLLLRCLHL